jgi:hypothetical protein
MSKKTLLVIKVDQDGVQEITARPKTIGEQSECARLTALIALPLRLLDDSIREAASPRPTQEFVPLLVNGER